MGYDLHILRPGSEPEGHEEIPVDEWLAAVDATEGVRRFTSARHSRTNPQTGEVISWAACPGDAEVLHPAHGWVEAFAFFEGAATFASRAVQLGDPADPIWRAAVALARRVGAIICGDEGERYDLETGALTGDDD